MGKTEAGLSEKSVRRIWHKHGLKPHLSRTFKVSNDPEFAEKLEAIIGLYLNPPEHAIAYGPNTRLASFPWQSSVLHLFAGPAGFALVAGNCAVKPRRGAAIVQQTRQSRRSRTPPAPQFRCWPQWPAITCRIKRRRDSSSSACRPCAGAVGGGPKYQGGPLQDG